MGNPHIKCDEVYSALQRLAQPECFTSRDVAEAMRVREYRVRAAMAWLVRSGKILRVGACRCYSRKRQQAWHWVATYQVAPAWRADVDSVAILTRAFGSR